MTSLRRRTTKAAVLVAVAALARNLLGTIRPISGTSPTFAVVD